MIDKKSHSYLGVPTATLISAQCCGEQFQQQSQVHPDGTQLS